MAVFFNKNLNTNNRNVYNRGGLQQNNQVNFQYAQRNNMQVKNLHSPNKNMNSVLSTDNEQMKSGEPFEHNGTTIYPVNEKNIKNLIESFKNPLESNKNKIENSDNIALQNEEKTDEIENITTSIENNWRQLINDETNAINFYSYLANISESEKSNSILRILKDKKKNQEALFRIYNKLFDEKEEYKPNEYDYNMSFRYAIKYALEEELVLIEHFNDVYEEYFEQENEKLNDEDVLIFDKILRKKIFHLVSLFIISRKY